MQEQNRDPFVTQDDVLCLYPADEAAAAAGEKMTFAGGVVPLDF
jgi:hypothetical protein